MVSHRVATAWKRALPWVSLVERYASAMFLGYLDAAFADIYGSRKSLAGKGTIVSHSFNHLPNQFRPSMR